MARNMTMESIWFDQTKSEYAETLYQEFIAKRHSGLQVQGTGITAPKATAGALSSNIEQAMNLIGQSLKTQPIASRPKTGEDLDSRVAALETENRNLKAAVACLEKRVSALEGHTKAAPTKEEVTPTTTKDDDDDFDLFGSEDEETDKVKDERLAQYAEKKSKKKVVIAKSSLILDVKPWDDETDLVEMERLVRGITADGLVWGASKVLPVVPRINKLQISCVIEDDKIGTDFLEESILAFEDLVQSVDIVAFNKI